MRFACQSPLLAPRRMVGGYDAAALNDQSFSHDAPQAVQESF
jgi:hypothetical protein